MAPHKHAARAEAHRSLLERVLTASARDVAPGGETGAWQWLIPVLVVMVIVAGAFAVVQSGREANNASQRATLGAALADVVARSQAEATAAVSHRRDARAVAKLRTSMTSIGTTLARLERETTDDLQVH